MNQFHDLNVMTSRGDMKGAFALISGWSEGVARKIMKKAGYQVPDGTGRDFWLWVQQTLAAGLLPAGAVAAGIRRTITTPMRR